MDDILKYIIESSIILAVFYFIYQMVLKEEKCFLFIRYYLLLTPIIAYTLPLIQLDISVLASGSENISTVYLKGVAATTATIEYWDLWDTFYTLYLLISIVISLIFCKKLHEIWKLNLIGEVQNHETYNIVSITKSNLIFTFLKNIYIPKNEKISIEILTHEKVHAKELHSLDIIFFEILTILFWFNPFIYLLKSASKLNHEFIADAKSSHINDSQSYINSLAKYHFKNMGLALGSHFGKPSILKRIQMINKQNTQTMKIKFIIPVIALLVMVTLFCCEEKLETTQITESPKTIVSEEAPNEVVGEIFNEVEELPLPIEGMEAFYKYVGQSMKYPIQAKRLGVEGKVFVEFIVDKTGRLTNVKAIKGIGAGCDAEAVRVIKTAANWKHGKQGGLPVNVRIVLPVSFKLRN